MGNLVTNFYAQGCTPYELSLFLLSGHVIVQTKLWHEAFEALFYGANTWKQHYWGRSRFQNRWSEIFLSNNLVYKQ